MDSDEDSDLVLFALKNNQEAINRIVTCLPVLRGGCGQRLTDVGGDSGGRRTSMEWEDEELLPPSALELGLVYTAFERDYHFHSTEVRHANQQPLFHEIVMRHWVSRPE